MDVHGFYSQTLLFKPSMNKGLQWVLHKASDVYDALQAHADGQDESKGVM